MEKEQYEFKIVEVDKVPSAVTIPILEKGGFGQIELKFHLAKLYLAIDFERGMIYIPSCDLNKLISELDK